MEPFTILHAIAAPMLFDNIDTDAITPAAAGKSTSVDLGAMLFNNARYDLHGNENPDFVLNQPKFRHSGILLAGRNFGCGSSRERAVWALMKFGIRCVIAPSFADIFTDNAFQNGLLPLVQDIRFCEELNEMLIASEAPNMTVDLQACQMTLPDGRKQTFTIPPERRMALLGGLDQMSLILKFEEKIKTFAALDRQAHPWVYPRQLQEEIKS
jgi:3-isopropylmalate/(R)-2-methylmalate dehydratase small subunit